MNYKKLSSGTQETVIQRIEFTPSNINSKYNELDNLRATLINNYYNQGNYNFLLRGALYRKYETSFGWNSPNFYNFGYTNSYTPSNEFVFCFLRDSNTPIYVSINRQNHTATISFLIDFGYIELVDLGGQQ